MPPWVLAHSYHVSHGKKVGKKLNRKKQLEEAKKNGCASVATVQCVTLEGNDCASKQSEEKELQRNKTQEKMIRGTDLQRTELLAGWLTDQLTS